MTLPLSEPVLLSQLRSSVSKTIPDDLGRFAVASMKLEAVRRTAWEMHVELRASMLAAQVLSDSQVVSIEFPASWWQHLKEHFPAWCRRRWPVRYGQREATVYFTRYDAYPLANIPFPPDEFGYPVRIEMSRLDFGSSGITLRPPGPPRFEYVNRRELASQVFELARERLSAMTDPRSDGPHPRYAIPVIFDALEQLGVNTSHLADKNAHLNPVPAKEEA